MSISLLHAEEYTYTFDKTEFTANETKPLNGIDWTIAGDGGYWGYDSNGRGQQFGSSNIPYKSLTMSTSGFAGNIISKIVINTSGASSINAQMSVSVGETSFTPSTISLTKTATDYEFTGSASGDVVFTWTQTSSKAIYVKSITVTYTSDPNAVVVAKPTFNPGNGTYYEAQSVTLSCNTEGATIKYFIGEEFDPGEEATTYEGPISVTETTTIHAYAIKGDVTSDVSTATYTIVEPEVIENIATFYNLASSSGKAVKFANPLTVIYQSYKNLIVKDETGTMLIYGLTSKDYSNGDVMEAGTIGTTRAYGGNPQLVTVSTKELPNATAGTPVEPKEVTITELKNCGFLDYVKVENVTFTSTDENKKYTISDGTNTFTAYNQFGLTINDLGEGKLFDVTGFVSSYNEDVQLQPTSVVYDDEATGIEEIATDNAPVEYYNLQGVKVEKPEKGIFIKKQGVKTTKVVL